MTGCNTQIQPSMPGISTVDMTGMVGVIAISTSQKPPGPFNSLIPPCQPLLMLITASQQRQQMSQHPHSWSISEACPRASPLLCERLQCGGGSSGPPVTCAPAEDQPFATGFWKKCILNALAVQMLGCSNLLYAALGKETHTAFILLEWQTFSPGLHEIFSYCLCWFSSTAVLALRNRWSGGLLPSRGCPGWGHSQRSPALIFPIPVSITPPCSWGGLKRPLCELLSVAGGLRQKPWPTHVLLKPGLTAPKIISAAKCMCCAWLQVPNASKRKFQGTHPLTCWELCSSANGWLSISKQTCSWWRLNKITIWVTILQLWCRALGVIFVS